MQTVILAAGRGTRMNELTVNTPKPMILVGGKPFLEYKIERLPKEIDEVILIVGYLGDQIRAHFGESFNGRTIKYVEQKELRGTGDALWLAKPLIKGNFLVTMADDIYSAEDTKEAIGDGASWSLVVMKEEKLKRGGKVILNKKQELEDVIEGDNHDETPGLLNAGMYVLSPEIFNYPPVQIPGRTEFGLPQTIVKASKDHAVRIVLATNRVCITEPKDIEVAEKLLMK